MRLLQRTTRTIALTEAGTRFHAHCVATVEGARAASDSVEDLRREPAGMVRMTSPQVMAETYLAPMLPAYLASHPKVLLELDASDRAVNLIEDRFDLALRAQPHVEDATGFVAREVGGARRVLVASKRFLDRFGRPTAPHELAPLDTIVRPDDAQDGRARWVLSGPNEREEVVAHRPRMLTNDMRMQLEAAAHGVGAALLPEPVVAASVHDGVLEHVLPDWAAAAHRIFLLYPKPRGMLPSMRSLIDYLLLHLPVSIQERQVPRARAAERGDAGAG